MSVDLDPNDFEGFGLKNSKVYYAKLFRLMLAAKLTKVARYMVMVLATAVKNKKRIAESISCFSTKVWYDQVSRFYQARVVQYTSEETVNTIAVIHIPSCMPSLTAQIWCLITPPLYRNLSSFLENLWAAQLDLNPAMMEEQDWEKVFWTKLVRKGGSKYLAGFHEEFWTTKATDTYELINMEGKILAMQGETYSREEVEGYINSYEVRGLVLEALPLPPVQVALEPAELEWSASDDTM